MYAQADQAEHGQHHEGYGCGNEEPRSSLPVSLPTGRDAEPQGRDQANRRQDDRQDKRNGENETIAPADCGLCITAS